MYTPARGVEIGISPGLRYSLAVRAQRNKCFGDIILHAPRGRVRAISLSPHTRRLIRVQICLGIFLRSGLLDKGGGSAVVPNKLRAGEPPRAGVDRA